MAVVLKDGIVKTKKDHRCHGCLTLLRKGSNVYSQTTVSDGIATLYMCNDCRDYCNSKKCRECYDMEEAYPGFINECNRNS